MIGDLQALRRLQVPARLVPGFLVAERVPLLAHPLRLVQVAQIERSGSSSTGNSRFVPGSVGKNTTTPSSLGKNL